MRSLLLYCASASMFVACGGDKPAATPATPAAPPAPAAAPAPPAPKAFVDPLPEGCPSDNEVVVSTAKLPSFEVKQAYYVTWAGVDGSVVFTNYDDFDPTNLYGHKVTGAEALVVVKLNNADSTPVGVGLYEATYQRDPKPAKQVLEFNVSTESLAGGVFDGKGTVEITHFGTDVVCGTIKADDGSSKITGRFITHYKKVQ